MTFPDKEDQLKKRLAALDEEKQKLLQELAAIDIQKQALANAPKAFIGIKVRDNTPETNDEKVRLFLDLFRCREDVFPKFWENHKNGRKGYSPVCLNEWDRPICKKPEIKCSECKNQNFPRLDAAAIEVHLKGQNIIGTYSIRKDDSCTFLACDFDEEDWAKDAFLYKNQAATLGVEALVERSRSGNGAHVWIFFNEPVPARFARALGTLILSKCTEVNHKIKLSSYDRFFPNQDFMPEGGFGNLIALPLQKIAREKNNSVFIRDDLSQYEDQWKALSSVKRLGEYDLRKILKDYMAEKSKPGEFLDYSFLMDQNIFESGKDKVPDLKGREITVSLGSMIRIPIVGMPSKLITQLRRIASFANPEFYKRQRMRMSTYDTPRFIFSGDLTVDELILPRGILDKVKELILKANAQLVITDERVKGKKLKVTFKGELRAGQDAAVQKIKKSDFGILQAPPGAGKTVMACVLMAERKVSTLILVHRQLLVSQWKERIESFLEIESDVIGVYTGTKKKLKGKIDIAMLPSLSKSQDLDALTGKYGQVIIDEVHHIPAASFEGVLKKFKAKYVVGLSATPYRKDGLDKIIFQQCGPIRLKMDSPDGGQLKKSVYIKDTGFKLPPEVGDNPAYTLLSDLIIGDEKRNDLIADDLVKAVQERRFPLLISDRKEQLTKINDLFLGKVNDPNVKTYRIDGELSTNQRKEILSQIEKTRFGGHVAVLFATASIIGEGFDLPELDTLILASPLSFEGRLIQYAGRLHRTMDGKSNIEVYDYVDSASAVSYKMFKNRLKTYKEMAYHVSAPTIIYGRSLFNTGV